MLIYVQGWVHSVLNVITDAEHCIPIQNGHDRGSLADELHLHLLPQDAPGAAASLIASGTGRGLINLVCACFFIAHVGEPVLPKQDRSTAHTHLPMTGHASGSHTQHSVTMF